MLWVLPLSLCALPLAPLVFWHGRIRWRDGALECHGPAVAWFLRGPWFRALTGGAGYAAATIGHVVLGRDADALTRCAVHERVHIRQAERWGALFPFAYLGAGLGAAIRYRSLAAGYWLNPFEIEARRAEDLASGDMNRQTK
ncbi:MAG: hypothetical protein ACK4XK_00380 [Casimicrobiaceae bacterium]